MSTEIEERVVQMKFDSKNFDRNIEETIQSLNQFESKLKLLGAQQGLENVQKAADDLNFAPMIAATSQVENRFNIMSLACIAAVTRMTNNVLSSAERMVKALTVDQVTAGWSKYADKTTAVQTIMAATAKNFSDTGEQMNYVNGQLEKLNWFTDETSYKFLDMVNNIGKFTSNNIALDTSVTAMQGIANWAAISGANANEASRAMYNLAQSMSKGYMQLIDWRSIENANMSTVEFKQTVIETALAVGTLEKTTTEGLYHVKGAAADATVSVENFSDQMAKGWFNSEVILQSLDKYGKFSTALFEVQNAFGGSTSEWLDWVDAYASGTFDIAEAVRVTGKDAGQLELVLKELSSAEYELGRRSFRAGQETKTFAEAIDYVKEAVSTSWMNTFEYIFGDYAQAKKLWTALANELYEVFVAPGEQRNEMVKEWMSMDVGGREDLLAGMSQAWSNLKDIIDAVREAFEFVFPPLTAQKLANLTSGFLNFTKQVKLSDEALLTIKNTCKLLLIPVRLATGLLQMAGYVLAGLAIAGVRAADAFLSLFAGVNKFEPALRKLIGDERYDRLATALTTIAQKISAAFTGVAETISNLFGKIKISDKLPTGLQKIADLLAPIAGWLLDRVIEGIEKLANMDYSKFGELVNNYLNKGVQHLKEMGGLFATAATAAEKFFARIKNSSPADALQALSDTWKSIKNFPAQIKSLLSMSTVFTSMVAQAEGLSGAFAALGDSLMALVSRLSPAKILIFSFGTAVTATMLQISSGLSMFAGILKSTKGVLDKTGGLLGAITERIKGSKINKIASALLMLGGALVVLSLVKPENLKAATTAMLELMAALTAMIAIFGLLDKFKVLDTENFRKISVSMAAMTVSISILIAALAVMGRMDLDLIWTRVAVLATIMTLLVLVLKAVSLMDTKAIKDVWGLVAFALAIASLVNTLKVLTGIPLDQLGAGVKALIPIMVTLAGVSLIMRKVKFSTGAGVLLLCLSLLAMAKVLIKISEMDTKAIHRGLEAIAGILVTLGAISIAISTLGGKGSKGFGSAVLSLSVSMLALAAALTIIAKIPANELANATVAVTTLIIVLGAVGVLAGMMQHGENMSKVGTMFVKMAVAILLLGLGINYLGRLDVATLAKGTIAVAAIMGFFAGILHVSKYVEKSKGAILAITAAIGLATTALVLLTILPEEEAKRAVKLFAAVMGSLAITMASLSLNKHGWKNAAITIGEMVLVIGATLGIISALNSLGLDDSILTKVKAFSILMLSIGTMMSILSVAIAGSSALQGIFTTQYGVIIAAIAAITAIGLETVGLLIWLNSLDIDTNIFDKLKAFAEIFTLLGIATAAIGGFISIFGKRLNPRTTTSALVSMVEIVVFLGLVLAGIAWATSKVGEYVNSHEEIISYMEAGKQFFIMLGEAIGGFFGALVGGAIDTAVIAATNDFYKVADNLDSFMDSAKPFFEKVENVSDAAVDGVKNLAAILTILLGENLLQSWSEKFSLADSFPEFTKKLSQGGDYLSDFGYAVSGLNPDELQGALALSDVIKSLSDAMSEINTGGLFTIFKNDDFSAMTKGLSEGADDLVDFGKKIVQIPEGTSQLYVLTKGIKTLMDGIPADWVDFKLKEFGEQLVSFAGSMIVASTNFQQVIYDTNVENAFALASKLKDLANEIPPRSTGFIGWLTSQSDLEIFGQKLSTFGGYMVGFANTTSRLDNKLITQANLIAEAATILIDEIPSGKKWTNSIFTYADVTQFSESLVTFSKALVDFYNEVGEINADLTSLDLASSLILKFGDNDTNNKIKAAATVLAENPLKAVNTKLGIKNYKSEQFINVGRYCVAGLTNGLQNKSELGKLNKAAIEMAEGVLTAVQTYYDINSPSVKFKEEVGVFIVQGIAEGITSDMSAEEAAVKKASNIAEAFKNAFALEMAKLDLHQAQYDLWGSAEGLVASDAETQYRTTLLYQDKLAAKALELKAAEGAYLTAVQQVGAGHVETIKLQTQMLQKQKEMNELAQEFATYNAENKGTIGSRIDTSVDYYSYLNSEEAKKLLAGGISQEELEAYAREKFGYSGMAAADGFTEGVITGFNNTDITSIVDYFTSGKEISVQVVQAAKTAGQGTGAAYAQGVAEGATNSQNSAIGFLEDLLNGESIKDAAENNGVEVGEYTVDGVVGSLAKGAERLIKAGVGGAQNIYEGLTSKEGIDAHSPSKKGIEVGEYVIDGLIIGLKETTGLENTSYKVGSLMIQTVTDGINDGKSSLISAMVQAATEAYSAAVSSLGLGGFSVAIPAVVAGLTTSGTNSKVGVAPISSSKTASTISTGLKANTTSRLAGAVSYTSKTSNKQVNDGGATKSVTNNTTYNFNQTNNSPKAISAADAYRAGNSGLAKFKAAIKETR